MIRVALLLVALLLAGCSGNGTSNESGGDGRLMANLRLHLVAAPVCPVETSPPDPSCAPRPLVGGTVSALSADGTLTLLTAGADGVAATRLPIGRYTLTPMPVEGVLTTAMPIEIELRDETTVIEREFVYDTGIR
jgi:hypothetical protein